MATAPTQQAAGSPASEATTVGEQKKTPAQERPPVLSGAAGLQLTSLDDIFRMADWIANSDFAPKDYRGKVENCVVAIEYGMELGLQPMAAIQNIAVVNGRPTLWGDAVPGVCMKRADLFDQSKYRCFFEGEEGTDSWTAVCECRRIGAEVTRRTFSVKDAKRAGLWGKGTYTSYPDIMLTNRARTFALRHAFPDVLKGMHTADEIDPGMAAERALADIDIPKTNAAIRDEMSKPAPEPPPPPANETTTQGQPPPKDQPMTESEIQGSETRNKMRLEWFDLAPKVGTKKALEILNNNGIKSALALKKCTDTNQISAALEEVKVAVETEAGAVA